jgi:hypothetical protein
MMPDPDEIDEHLQEDTVDEPLMLVDVEEHGPAAVIMDLLANGYVHHAHALIISALQGGMDPRASWGDQPLVHLIADYDRYDVSLRGPSVAAFLMQGAPLSLITPTRRTRYALDAALIQMKRSRSRLRVVWTIDDGLACAPWASWARGWAVRLGFSN